jgi:hypothetical protein
MEYRLFAEPKAATAPAKSKERRKRRGPLTRALWESKASILATGLVLAGDTLFVAGPPDVLDETRKGIRQKSPGITKAIHEQEAALAGKRGAILMAVAKADGATRARLDLGSPPVFDGLIAANQKLFMALQNGVVECWKEK